MKKSLRLVLPGRFFAGRFLAALFFMPEDFFVAVLVFMSLYELLLKWKNTRLGRAQCY
jgi:hypothetical protein